MTAAIFLSGGDGKKEREREEGGGRGLIGPTLHRKNFPLLRMQIKDYPGISSVGRFGKEERKGGNHSLPALRSPKCIVTVFARSACRCVP